MDTLYIIDGNSFAYRAFFAMPPLTTRDGIEVQAVYGFYNMFRKILVGKKPSHIAIAFDHPKPTFRHKMYKQYKEQREKMPESLRTQMKMIKEIAQKAGIRVMEAEGYEADDIIGSAAIKAASEGVDVFMATSDKDMMQVVTDKIKLFKFSSKTGEVIMDPAYIKETFGIEPGQIIEVLGLMGDASDNIPGVEGIGEKTAYKLVQEFGTVDNLLKNIDKVKSEKLRRKILDSHEDLMMSMELATIKTGKEVLDAVDYTLKSCEASNVDRKVLDAEFIKYNFKSLVDNETVQDEVEVKGEAEEVSSLKETTAAIKKAESVCVFFGGEEEAKPEMTMIKAGKKLFYCFGGPAEMPPEILNKEIITNSLKTLCKVLGEKPSGKAYDLMIMAYLLNPEKTYKSISGVMSEYEGGIFLSFEEIAGKGAKKVMLQLAEKEAVNKYACSILMTAEKLKNDLCAKLETEKLDGIYNDMEAPLAAILASMEKTGVKIDAGYLDELLVSTEKQVAKLEKQIFKLSGTEFNINSPKQLGEVLFDKMDLPKQKKTKTGYSTDNEVLTTLAAHHEIAASILEYRSVVKLKTGFLDAIKGYMDKNDKIYPDYNQTVAATGRLSSSNPNIQNIPVRGEAAREIRKIFLPLQKGDIILKADYSQIELRILAHVSGDKKLINEFKTGGDIHTLTATEVFGAAADQVTKDQRRAAKTINFGIVYGLSPFGLAKELGVSNHEAGEYIAKFFMTFPGIKKYQEETIESAKKKGYVETLFGRRRYMANINSANRAIREFAERAAINAPIQGTAADIIKLAMIEIEKVFEKEKFASKMFLQVHDELVFSVPSGEKEKVEAVIREKMESSARFDVPITVTVGEGKNWYECG